LNIAAKDIGTSIFKYPKEKQIKKIDRSSLVVIVVIEIDKP
jgi:hypothetical protein